MISFCESQTLLEPRTEYVLNIGWGLRYISRANNLQFVKHLRPRYHRSPLQMLLQVLSPRQQVLLSE